MGVGFGLGYSLVNTPKDIEEVRTAKARREALATEMALRQQEIAQSQQRMDLEKQKFGAELPFLKQQPERFAFQQTVAANPDWMGSTNAVDLARKLGVATPTPQQPSQVIGNVQPQAQDGQVNKMPSVSDAYSQAGVYPETGIPISPDRQANLTAKTLANEKGKTELNILQNPGEFLNNLLQTPPQASPTSGIGSIGGNAPVAGASGNSSASGMPLPPPEKRVEGQTYIAPGNLTVQWVKTPSGGYALKQVQKANPNPLANPDARTRLAIDMFGKVSGTGMKSSDVMPAPGQTRQDLIDKEVDKKNVDAMFPPAQIQRGLLALQSASNETDQALQQLEKLYPGIVQSARLADNQKQSPSWMQFLMGKTVPYGDASSQAKIGNERLKYAVGAPTPLAKAIQLSSFANLEQMSGQLPGIRGFQQLLPLFKTHQASIGFESPVQSVQRLLHMKEIMANTAEEMKTPIQMTPQQ